MQIGSGSGELLSARGLPENQAASKPCILQTRDTLPPTTTTTPPPTNMPHRNKDGSLDMRYKSNRSSSSSSSSSSSGSKVAKVVKAARVVNEAVECADGLEAAVEIGLAAFGL